MWATEGSGETESYAIRISGLRFLFLSLIKCNQVIKCKYTPLTPTITIHQGL